MQAQLDEERDLQQSLKAMPRKKARTGSKFKAWLREASCPQYSGLIRAQGFIMAALAGFLAYMLALNYVHVLLAGLLGVVVVPLVWPAACKWLRSKQQGSRATRSKSKGGRRQ